MSNQHQPSKHTDIILIILVLTGLGLSICGISAMLMVSAFQGLSMSGSFEPFGLTTALTYLTVGLSGIPLALISLRRLNDPSSDKPRSPSKNWFLILLLYPPVIIIGHLIFKKINFSPILGAVAQVFAALIPAVAMILIARRNGPPMSGRRTWALYLGGAWLAPILSLIIEAVVMIPFGAFVLGHSNDLPQLQHLIEQLRQGSTVLLGEDQTLELILQPVIWIPILLFVSLLVPMIEEVFKSIAVWPLLNRRMPPGEAFVAGVICGASYAFVEALLLASPDPQWSITMVARVGATMMHSFTTGIVAWGLAKAWSENRPGFVFRTYGLAVFFHGLWNAITLVIVGLGIRSQTSPPISEGIILAGILVGLLLLLGLAGGAFIGIAKLSKKFNPPILPDDSPADQLSG